MNNAVTVPMFLFAPLSKPNEVISTTTNIIPTSVIFTTPSFYQQPTQVVETTTNSLLTCGITQLTANRVVGGTEAKRGLLICFEV